MLLDGGVDQVGTRLQAQFVAGEFDDAVAGRKIQGLPESSVVNWQCWVPSAP